MRHVLADRLSVGEFIALYEQAQDYVFARAKEAEQIPPGARSDEVIFEFGRRVEEHVKRDYRVDQFAAVHERKEGVLYVDWDEVRGFVVNGSNGEMRLALALLAMGRRVEELEEEISIWRSFMVPEPVRERRDISREVCGNE